MSSDRPRLSNQDHSWPCSLAPSTLCVTWDGFKLDTRAWFH